MHRLYANTTSFGIPIYMVIWGAGRHHKRWRIEIHWLFLPNVFNSLGVEPSQQELGTQCGPPTWEGGSQYYTIFCSKCWCFPLKCYSDFLGTQLKHWLLCVTWRVNLSVYCCSAPILGKSFHLSLPWVSLCKMEIIGVLAPRFVLMVQYLNICEVLGTRPVAAQTLHVC